MFAKLTKTKKFTLLAIVFSICLVFCLRSHTSISGAIVNERVLSSGTYTSTIGGYTIEDTSKVIDACGNNDVRNALSNTATTNKQKELDDSMMIYGRTHLNEWLKTGDFKYVIDYIKANKIVYAGPVFFVVLSVISFLFLFIWILTFSYCKPDNAEDGCCRGPCCQKTCCFMTIVWPLFLFVFTIGWIFTMGGMIDSLDHTKCGVVSILNDIKNGVNYVTTDGTYSQFSGLKGYVYIFEEFLSNWNSTRSDTYGYDIAVERTDTQGTTMYDTLASYYSTYRTSTVTSPYDGSTAITPDSISSLTSTISSDIGTEYTTLNTYAANIYSMSTYVYGVSNGLAYGSTNWATYETAINGAVSLFDSLYDVIDNMKIKADAMTDHKQIMKFVTYGIGIFILFLTIWFWISLLFTHKLKKCECFCACCGKITMMLKIVFSMLFCILGMVFIIAAGVAVNICHFQYQLYNDTTFYSDIKPTETNFQNFLNACAFTTSSGLLTDYLTGDQQTAFTQLTDIYDGLYNYGQYKAAYYDKSQSTPTTILASYNKLTDYHDFSVDDYTNQSSDSHYDTVQTSLNSLTSCAGDKWVLYTGGSNCSGYTIWTMAYNETYGNTSANSMCMSVSAFGDSSYTAGARYFNSTCMSIADISTADTTVNNLHTFYTSANTLYTNQQATLASASGSKQEGETLFTKFDSSINDYSNLNSDFSTYYTYVNAFQNTTTDLKSCSIFRTDMLIFSNTICFKTIAGFVDQTFWICFMGPSLCLMAIFMCAAIRCPLQKNEDSKVFPQPQQYGQQPQFQNIDKDTGSPTRTHYVPPNLDDTGQKFLPPIYTPQQQAYQLPHQQHIQQQGQTGIPQENYNAPQNLNDSRQQFFQKEHKNYDYP